MPFFSNIAGKTAFFALSLLIFYVIMTLGCPPAERWNGTPDMKCGWQNPD